MSEAQSSGVGLTPAAQTSNPKLSQAATPDMPDFKAFKHKATVDGAEIEVDYDELRRGYSHAKAANQRFQKAAEVERAAQQRQAQADSVLKRFDDPRQALGVLVEKFGKVQAREYLEDFLLEEMEYEALPAAEKRAREFEKRAKALEDELTNERKSQEDIRRSQIEAKAHGDLDVEVGEALKALGRKPTPRMVIAVVDEMILQGQMQKRRVTANEALPHFQRTQHANAVEWLSGLSPADAIKILPKSLLDGLRQHEVTQVLGEKQRRRPAASEQPAADSGGKKLGLDDWFENKKKQLAKQSRK